MTRAELEQYVKERIYPNNAQEITGEVLQSTLLVIVASILERGEIDQDIATAINNVVSNFEPRLEAVESKSDYNSVRIENQPFTRGTSPSSAILKGSSSKASGEFSSALGYSNESNAHGANSEGGYNKSIAEASHTEGVNTEAGRIGKVYDLESNGADTEWIATHLSDIVDVLNQCRSIGLISHDTEFNTLNALAFIYNNTSAVLKLVGYASHAEGEKTTASGTASHAEGENTTALNYASHSEGEKTTAYGAGAHAEGISSLTFEEISKLEGETYLKKWENSGDDAKFLMATGAGAHAEGYDTYASGGYAHAEGYQTLAGGNSAHAEGYRTNASARYSHAGGLRAKASGASSFAHGQDVVASGVLSFASGNGTKATHTNEVAFGKFNKSNSKTLFSIGNGSSDTQRSNVFEVRSDNTAYIGDVKIMTQDDYNRLLDIINALVV